MAPIEVAIVIDHAMKVVNLTGLVLTQHERSHIKAVHGETDLVSHFLVQSGVVRLESIEAKNEHGWQLVDLHLFRGVNVLLTATAVPCVV